MKAIILAIGLMSASSGWSVVGHFSGVWEGTGSLQMPNGSTLSCNAITYQILQGPLRLAVNNGHVSCPPRHGEDLPQYYRIFDGSLFINGSQVGEIDDNQFTAQYFINPNLQISILVQLESGTPEQIKIIEIYSDYSGQTVQTLTAVLQKSSIDIAKPNFYENLTQQILHGIAEPIATGSLIGKTLPGI